MRMLARMHPGEPIVQPGVEDETIEIVGPRHTLFPMALLAATAACDRPETAGQPSAVTIRDSAGIQIVENQAPQWDEGTAWTVASEPAIAIGGYRGSGEPRDSSHLVWDIRDIVPLSDGRVAMLSRGEKKVFVF